MIRLARSIVGDGEAKALARVILEDGYLGMGSEVQAFELEIANFLRVPVGQVACVNSGTAALHLAAESLLRPGDEVLVQSFTYVSTYQAISATGAVPVSCEIDPATITICLEDAAARLTDRTRAIMPVHYASNPGELDAIFSFAEKYGLRVIEDAAHAFGCSYNGKLIGSFGDVTCFSFDGIKNITSGEGGAVVSADPEVISRVRDARLLGVEKDTENRYAHQRSWEFDVKRQGYRYHMSNLFAAIGRVQLQRFEKEFAPKRVALSQCYRELLADLPGLVLLDTCLGPIVPHLQPVRVQGGKRDALRGFLEVAGIQTGIHYLPNHFLTYYGGGACSLPVTEMVYTEILSLPLHPGMELCDVGHICGTIKSFFERYHG